MVLCLTTCLPVLNASIKSFQISRVLSANPTRFTADIACHIISQPFKNIAACMAYTVLLGACSLTTASHAGTCQNHHIACYTFTHPTMSDPQPILKLTIPDCVRKTQSLSTVQPRLPAYLRQAYSAAAVSTTYSHLLIHISGPQGTTHACPFLHWQHQVPT
jgi:hypothetical protein